MNKIQVESSLTSEIYQQLQTYMTDQGLSEAAAIEAIVNRYLTDNIDNELMKRIAKMEQDLSDVKRHVLAIRFHSR